MWQGFGVQAERNSSCFPAGIWPTFSYWMYWYKKVDIVCYEDVVCLHERHPSGIILRWSFTIPLVWFWYIFVPYSVGWRILMVVKVASSVVFLLLLLDNYLHMLFKIWSITLQCCFLLLFAEWEPCVVKIWTSYGNFMFWLPQSWFGWCEHISLLHFLSDRQSTWEER